MKLAKNIGNFKSNHNWIKKEIQVFQ